MRRLQTDVPDCSDRSSGSRVRFPVRITRLMLLAAMPAWLLLVRHSGPCLRVYGRGRNEMARDAGFSAKLMLFGSEERRLAPYPGRVPPAPEPDRDGGQARA